MEHIPYKFYVTTAAGIVEAFPKNGNALAVSWEKDENAAFFRKRLTGKLKFTGSDFDYLLVQEKSTYRCNPIIFDIEKDCGAGYNEFYSGMLYCNKGTWDIDSCVLDIEVTTKDIYSCYDSGKDTEINLLSYVDSSRVVNTIKGTIETLNCHHYGYPPIEWCGSGDPYAQGWTIQDYSAITDASGSPQKITTDIIWIREKITSLTPLSYPWISIGGNDYARSPVLYNKVNQPYTDRQIRFFYQYGASFGNGMRLKDIFTAFLNYICPGVTLISDFFQWNPLTVTDINYQTGQLSKVLNIIVFQKSDVKRPADDDATDATTSFDRILQDVCKIWKLNWWIEAGVSNDIFRIEHPSYFNKEVGIDLTISREDSQLRAGKTIYSYEVDNLPNKELFRWMDEVLPGDFKGTDIIYTNTCGVGSDSNNKTIAVENVTTDVQLCLNNPDSESNIVSDEGFVFIACDEDDYMLYQAPIIGGNKLNNTLSWASLQNDYWKFNTYFNDFNLNNLVQVSQRVLPTKKQSGVSLVLCCGDSFNPDDYVLGVLGNGIVQTASLGLYDNILKLDLLFEDAVLNVNQPPVANNDTVQTNVGVFIDIDVLANASDPDGTIDASTLTIVTAPVNGTAVITMANKIRYTPNPGFKGQDSFTWNVKDNLGEVSNNALELINVIQPAIAQNDNYRVAQDKSLNYIDAYNLLGNDSGEGILVCVDETKPTVNGGTVIINTNGRFKYTPAPGYIGIDSFTYTLKDSNNSTDVGTVSIDVFETVPVYAKLIVGPAVINNITDICSTGPKVTGTETRRTFTVNFYSNAGGTIPLDVTGYGTLLQYNLKQVLPGGTFNNFYNKPLDGISISLDNIVVDHTDNGCNGTLAYHYTQNILLIATSDYTIIA